MPAFLYILKHALLNSGESYSERTLGETRGLGLQNDENARDAKEVRVARQIRGRPVYVDYTTGNQYTPTR